MRYLAALLLSAFFGVPATAAEKIVFGLDYVPSGQHAPFYVARDKGFFAENGLDVDIQRGYGSTDAVKRVASGAVDIAFGDTGAVIMARADGLKVKSFAMIYVNAPYTLILRHDAEVKTPADLIGKTLAGPVGSATRVMFPLFARKAGLDPAKVNWYTTDASNLLPVLLSGRAAGVSEYYAGYTTYMSKAKENGVALDIMRYSDYGVDIYSNGLVARDETISAHPDMLKRFVKALKEAYGYSFAHPQDAAEILAKAQPQLAAAEIVGNIKSVQELDTPKNPGTHPWGYIQKDLMLSTQAAVVDAFAAENASKVAIDDCFTNQFVE